MPMAAHTAASPALHAHRRGGSFPAPARRARPAHSHCVYANGTSRADDDTQPRRRIAVVGAGIAGLTTTLALRRAGWDATVYELQRNRDLCAARAKQRPPWRCARLVRALVWPGPSPVAAHLLTRTTETHERDCRARTGIWATSPPRTRCGPAAWRRSGASMRTWQTASLPKAPSSSMCSCALRRAPCWSSARTRAATASIPWRVAASAAL